MDENLYILLKEHYVAEIKYYTSYKVKPLEKLLIKTYFKKYVILKESDFLETEKHKKNGFIINGEKNEN